MTSWTDIHAHLNMLEISVDEALAEAKAQGIEQLITICTNSEDIDYVLETAKNYFPRVACSVGVHPHDAKDWNQEIKNKIQANVDKDYVVCLGEMGLDYFYENSPIEQQKKAFREQLELALKHDLPVQIHTRDAEEDTIEILKSFNSPFKGVIHCFTGTSFLRDESLKLGLDISISGIVTFKSAKDLREVISEVPLNRMHIETDSPFLAPVPMRGKKNQPAFAIHTAEFVAKLKNVPMEVLKEQVRINNQRTFSKLFASTS
ncbi:MAG: TatD family hydrolase [Bdellovibrionales bacterium]